LATGEARAQGTPLPLALNGTSVTINGVAVPLLSVSARQINAQAPVELAPGKVAAVVLGGSTDSVAAPVDVAAVAPGILATADGHTLAVNYPGATLNSASNPAHPGEYVVVYLTGQGKLDQPVASGNESPAEPLALPLAPVLAKLGGTPAAVAFAGMAPGFVGLLQVNLLVPDVPAGEQALAITVGGAAANPTTLWVAPNH
jgi:adhesin/invasin